MGISKGEISRGVDFRKSYQYYLSRQKNNRCIVYSNICGMNKKSVQCQLMDNFGIDDIIGMTIDLKQYKLTFFENLTDIISVDIDKSQTYHIFFGFRDTKMVWKVVSFDAEFVKQTQV